MVTADEPSYTMALDVNREFDSDKLRYTYTSLVTPRTTYDYDVKTGERELLKRDPVLGGYDPANYATEFAWADGARRHQGAGVHRVPQDHAARRHRAAAADRLRLVRRIATIRSSPICRRRCSIAASSYAIAHIRGGQEMGRAWYENGKLLNKKNTFTDFIDVTRWLGANKLRDRTRPSPSGGRPAAC